MKRTRLGLSIVVGLVFMLAAPAWADLEAGLEAWSRGDYETALKEWRLLAEQGDADAQVNLGVMYHKGQGVPQDYQEAVRWYRLAAEGGFAEAQYYLGDMYCCVKGVKADRVQAHMWFNLAASQGYYGAVTAREKVANGMTPDQIAEAQRLAREWKPNRK